MAKKTYKIKTTNTVDAIQYDGTNAAELMAFAPGWIFTDEDSNLRIKYQGKPILTTEWVMLTIDGEYEVVKDQKFKNHFDVT